MTSLGCAEPKLTADKKLLQDLIRKAHAEGASVATLAMLAGLSRQRVSVIVAKR